MTTCIHGIEFGHPCYDCVICPDCVLQFPAIPVNVQRELQAKDRTIERLKEALESIATKCLCGWEPPPDNCPCLSCTARKALQEPT